ncbi:7-carboxy-7-deazaguanine synthase QueE [Picrophilus oshimae]|uniref:7-carboxy-7-deazaguanine synthase n=1 Tax=Picrophilus torridus (strain ATCC 700027 / DSM 9790 / JCM 10055 / NBRC 100828 / KAW 2/3) TaxID=1122961 RepID=A0A8G2L7N2_PICTO|nr:7-carboxy-7-deazaguanine synthase QueE [Picrophilus oshimae]SMD31273.1 6-pyruvoyltetrahydropterin 2'-reductase [Picrophilus oshimae DSM 9789]
MGIRLVDLFYSIQGEGRYAGKPAFFIRFPECNLFCGLEKPLKPGNYDQEYINNLKSVNAGWVCDTMAQWLSNGFEIDINDIVDYISRLSSGSYNIVFTGGEPLINRSNILKIIDAVNSKNLKPYIYEIETNGTMEPIEDDSISYNISLKLSGSGMKRSKRINSNIIRKFLLLKNTWWKFVISNRNDAMEAIEIMDEYGIKRDSVYFMPAAFSRDELVKNSVEVIEMCKEFGVNYSPRLQIFIYDKYVGV